MAHMVNDHHNKVKIVEQYQVSPPPGSVPSTSIPLTFFDLPWLCCPPIKRIFFYNFPYSIRHFLQTVIPNLKHSLSLTLQHFFPFAAHVVLPRKPHTPRILYSDGDSISFTIAKSTADFTNLVSDSPRNVTDLHPFVPVLPSPSILEDGTQLIPSMAIQVTVLPNSRFTICITFRHVIADGKAFHHFMKFWASLCRSKGVLPIVTWFAGLAHKQQTGSFIADLWYGTLLQYLIIYIIKYRNKYLNLYHRAKYLAFLATMVLASIGGFLALPLHNRDIIKDPKGLNLSFLENIWSSSLESIESTGLIRDVPSDMVRHRFVLSRDHVDKLKKWISNKCKTYGLRTLHMSTFVVTCSLIWVCKTKSEETIVSTFHPNNDESYILAFMADCRNHPEFSIPSNYFGNCLGCGNVVVKRSKLVGENGIAEAAIAIGNKVRDLQCEAFKGVEILMSNFTEFASLGQHMVIVAGSQKLNVYDTDFGWGKPKMSEVVHVDNSGTISLSDCRDKEGGIEVGLALKRIQMKKFNTILEEHLKEIALHG